MKIWRCFFLLVFLLLITSGVIAEEGFQNIEELNKKINDYATRLEELSQQKKTLSSSLNYLKTKISLTETQILQTKEKLLILEKEIQQLSERIERLDLSLNELSKLLLSRIQATYKRSRLDPVYYLFVANGLNDFLNRMKYLKVVQLHDRNLLYQMEQTRMNFDVQKNLKEEKQKEVGELKEQLENQNRSLSQQKQEKETLLEITKNDESRYQKLLSEAQNELQSLLAAKFTGKKHVEKGEIVGLMGNTGFSFGAHLHFGVYNLKEADAANFNYFENVVSPWDYLESKSVTFEARACDDVTTSLTKTVGTGGWMWPMENPKISQCFGHTPWSWRYSGNFHHGIDMYNTTNYVVKVVEAGEAYFYKEQSSMGNHVRIFHNDGKMTLYLHLQ